MSINTATENLCPRNASLTRNKNSYRPISFGSVTYDGGGREAQVRSLVRIPIVVAPGSGGFVGYVPVLRGAHAEGPTKAETIADLHESLTAILEGYKAEKRPVAWNDEPEFISEGDVDYVEWLNVDA